MEFKTDILSLRPPAKSTFALEGAKLPTNLDIYFRAKQEELCNQYLNARMFMEKTETKDNEWDYWFNRLSDSTNQYMIQLELMSTFYEVALFYYNIVVDLSWTLCYVCTEFSCEVDGKRVSSEGMKSIEDACKILRTEENIVRGPANPAKKPAKGSDKEDTPYEYFKKTIPEYIPVLEFITDFWNKFCGTPIRTTYNYCKHKGKPIYKELADQEERFNKIYIKEYDTQTQIPSDIRDIQLKLSIFEEIERLKAFDDEKLFPYISELLILLEDIVQPSTFLVT